MPADPPTLTVILGPPATGKTTLRQALTTTASLSIDDYRHNQTRNQAWQQLARDAQRHLTNGHDTTIEGCRFTLPLHQLTLHHPTRIILCTADTTTRRTRLQHRGLSEQHIERMLNEPAPTTRLHTLVDTTDDPQPHELRQRASERP